MNKKIFLIVGISVYLSACGLLAVPIPTITPTLAITTTFLLPPETATVTPVLPTPSPLPTESALVFQGPDKVIVPILLYHHIDVSLTDSEYYVSPDKFEEQLKLLQDWGYTTISTQLLVKAITKGADLPPRPLLINFDDGHLDNYTAAFPIMQKYGFTGVVYIVGSYMGASEFMNAEQIKAMVSAGWEVGSHSMKHLDLTNLDPEEQRYEIADSRSFLESKLGVPVLTFAYPFGLISPTILDYTYFAGYIAGMGLGPTTEQIKSNLFALQRREIHSSYDLKRFASFLPWQGDPVYLPTDTSTLSITPSRTPIPTYTLFPTSTSPQ
jgi:peptidoglycan/xylan/chitin deacetylase (PgdA/CDA1 family)